MKMRGILTPSKILDYLDGEDIEKKISALLEKETAGTERRKEEFYEVMNSSLSKEEKEDAVKALVNEKLTDSDNIEREQRLAALRIRKDYAELKKNEDRAFKAILAGKFLKYDRYIEEAAKIADLVDMGLEYLENAREFFEGLEVTKVRLVSEEEAKEHLRAGAVRHVSSMERFL
jgi:hypothetical protein